MAVEMIRLLLALILVFAVVVAAYGQADAVCSISATPIVFGTYDVLNKTPTDTTGAIIYRCQGRDQNITITLDRGGAPSFATRLMLSGSNQLLYNLFMDAARTVIWGDGTGGTQLLFVRNPQPNNQNINVPVYGRIPALQDVRVGNYTNTIIATINF